jgi:hypothetical protein
VTQPKPAQSTRAAFAASSRNQSTRCVMVELPQVELGEDGGLLRAIGDLNDLRLGVVADVARTGAIGEGEAAYLSG